MLDIEITHSHGKYSLLIFVSPEGLNARIKEGDNVINNVLTGRSEIELLDNCRCWASTNIRGEFQIDRVTRSGTGEGHANAA
jgi:hypothetical protein